MLAVLGVAVAAVAVVAVSDKRDMSPAAERTSDRTITRTATAPASTGKSSPAPTSSSSTSSPGDTGTATGVKGVPLVVLNNSTVGGLAKRAAKQFRDGGWTVTSTDNLQNDILSSCAYYDPSTKGAKKAAEALQQQFPGIQRVVEKFAELPAGPVVVVLTGDYQVG